MPVQLAAWSRSWRYERVGGSPAATRPSRWKAYGIGDRAASRHDSPHRSIKSSSRRAPARALRRNGTRRGLPQQAADDGDGHQHRAGHVEAAPPAGDSGRQPVDGLAPQPGHRRPPPMSGPAPETAPTGCQRVVARRAQGRRPKARCPVGPPIPTGGPCADCWAWPGERNPPGGTRSIYVSHPRWWSPTVSARCRQSRPVRRSPARDGPASAQERGPRNGGAEGWRSASPAG